MDEVTAKWSQSMDGSPGTVMLGRAVLPAMQAGWTPSGEVPVELTGWGKVVAAIRQWLRGVAQRPPYMHAGQLGTLEQVVRHYVAAPHAVVGHSELTHRHAGASAPRGNVFQ